MRPPMGPPVQQLTVVSVPTVTLVSSPVAMGPAGGLNRPLGGAGAGMGMAMGMDAPSGCMGMPGDPGMMGAGMVAGMGPPAGYPGMGAGMGAGMGTGMGAGMGWTGSDQMTMAPGPGQQQRVLQAHF